MSPSDLMLKGIGQSGGAAGGSVFVSDTFTDADGTLLSAHVGEIGATWTQNPASLRTSQIAGNAVRVSSSGAVSLYYASGLPATAEYDVQATFSVVVTTGNTFDGIVGRQSVADDTSYCALWNQTAGARWELYRIVAGVSTLLGFFAGDDPSGAARIVKLQIRDAAKKVFVDGVERISSADNAIAAAGRAGVRPGTSTAITDASGIRIDTLTATNV